MPAVKWAVVIVNYRTDDLARVCMASAVKALGPTAEILMVDTTADGSSDLHPRGDDRTVIRPGDVGYAGGLNAGLHALTTPWDLVALVNADVVFPDRHGMGELAAVMRAHPRVGVLGPRQVTPSGRIAHAGIQELGDTTGGRGFGNVDRGQYRERYLSCAQVSGSVMIVRRAALAAVGGRVPSPAHLYFEDVAFCDALRAAGWTVAYSGVATFTHHVAASPSEHRAVYATAARRAWLESRAT